MGPVWYQVAEVLRERLGAEEDRLPLKLQQANDRAEPFCPRADRPGSNPTPRITPADALSDRLAMHVIVAF
jgi:hypothetical protein